MIAYTLAIAFVVNEAIVATAIVWRLLPTDEQSRRMDEIIREADA